MLMKIQLSSTELTDILAEHLDQIVVQYSVNPENIDKITASCEPDGELESLSIYLDFDSTHEAHDQSDE